MALIVFHGVPPGQDLELVAEIERILTGKPYRSAITYAHAPIPCPDAPCIEVVASACGFLEELLVMLALSGLRVVHTKGMLTSPATLFKLAYTGSGRPQ